ncbi:glycosyl transferase family 1 [Burkholderia cepacia JBK9]|nr:glycosyl transferase family 1 [Burkholderia cepacia JBK9]
MPLTRFNRAALAHCAATHWHAPLTRYARHAADRLRTSTQSAPASREHQLLVDVSIIAQHDAGTGIQRVVRSLALQLIASPPPGFVVRLVRANRRDRYRYADIYAAKLAGTPPPASDAPVHANPGDVFLGLDLTSRIAPKRQRDFLQWKQQGVLLAFVVYDLLPIQHPEWFTPRSARSFKQWLSTIAIHADALYCISRSVAVEAQAFLDTYFGIAEHEVPAGWFHLGADFQPHPANATGTMPRKPRMTGRGHTVLMVGTIEPRKGHRQVLDAFEALWNDGVDATLVIVGNAGWAVQELTMRLDGHAERGKRLNWLQDIDDAALADLYARADGLLFASEGEGFGLPIVEAAQHGLPLLLRDLPVFREVAGEHATYFSACDGTGLASSLHTWLRAIDDDIAPDSRAIRPITWQESAAQIKTLLSDLSESR